MAARNLDPVTGRETTGHEWNGIEELDTPVPRVVLFFLAVTTLFAIGYWVLMPAWPLGATYTQGLLGIDQRQVVTRQVEEAAAQRAQWTRRIASEDLAGLAADPAVMDYVRESGRAMFTDNCAACHGAAATGGPGFPDLTAGRWLWGGDPDALAETIRVGINAAHDETRMSQMMAYGRDGILDRDAIHAVTAYVRSLSGQALDETARGRLEAGAAVFADNCTGCHGEDGAGMVEAGAPDLTDASWIYGGDARSVFSTISQGRQGHMPHWEGRLSPADIRLLALYVAALGDDAP